MLVTLLSMSILLDSALHMWLPFSLNAVTVHLLLTMEIHSL